MPKKKKFKYDFVKKGQSVEEYFLGADPRKHKDYKYFGGK
jgi:hypothetical protein